jgi:hypothetical protein
MYIVMLVLILFLLIFITIIYFIINKKTENFTSYSIDAMDQNLKYEVEDLLNKVIEDINKNHNKELLVGNIDRVEKTNHDDKINYVINAFIYNKKNFTNTNRKVSFDIDITDKEIIVNSISKGFSRDIVKFQRGGVSTRGSTLFKPNYDILKVRSNETPILDYSKINYNETPNKMVDRNSWILPNDIPENKLLIPSRKIIHVWDCNGVEITSDTIKNIPILNHGMKPMNNIPDFIKYNFENKSESSNNSWLFDLSSDSASRPIGITGSSGTK